MFSLNCARAWKDHSNRHDSTLSPRVCVIMRKHGCRQLLCRSNDRRVIVGTLLDKRLCCFQGFFILQVPYTAGVHTSRGRGEVCQSLTQSLFRAKLDELRNRGEQL